MNECSFECLLYGIVTNTVKNIMNLNGWTEDYSLEKFVDSKVYSFLEDEKTKVWHYSPMMLAILFNEEREGELVWPDVI
jgi:hypothetical protein